MARPPAHLGIPDMLRASSCWRSPRTRPPTGTRGAKETYERLVRPDPRPGARCVARRSGARVLDRESLLPRHVLGRAARTPGRDCRARRRRTARVVGGGVTVPDTCLPDTEAILRDYLLGCRWLESRGITRCADVCSFPKNAGASPCLPELLRAAGFGAVAWSRLDGMYVRGGDYRPVTDYPAPGSTAARLHEQRWLDFVWRSGWRDVLAHWNAFDHDQGDFLAARWGWFRDRSVVRRGIAHRRGGRAAPPARPHALPPLPEIGGDFHAPIPNLKVLVARYDAERFPESGTWVVLGGLDDYFALLEAERDKLPVLELDPNPVWMGSLASRGALKARCAGSRARWWCVTRRVPSANPAITRGLGGARSRRTTRASSPAPPRRGSWRASRSRGCARPRTSSASRATAMVSPSSGHEGPVGDGAVHRGDLDRRQRRHRDPDRAREGRARDRVRSPRQPRNPQSALVRGHRRARAHGARAPRRDVRARRLREHAPRGGVGHAATARLGPRLHRRDLRATPRGPHARAPRGRRRRLGRSAGEHRALAHRGRGGGPAPARRARHGRAGRTRAAARGARRRADVLARAPHA